MLYKYPRTPHLPFSPGATNDDRILQNIDHFLGEEVVVTVKMDGENTSIYRDHIHARSLDSANHISRNWLKNRAAEWQVELQPGWRICGENLYARHSIEYNHLKSFFYMFSMWNDDECFSWDETENWAHLLDIELVPVLYRGIWNEDVIKGLYSEKMTMGDNMEGYVVRKAGSFSFDSFGLNLAKYVRKGHVQTSKHWMFEELKRNQLDEPEKVH
jgi:RNA ligase